MAGGKRRPHRTPTPIRTPNRGRHANSANKPAAGASRKWNATGYSYADGKADVGADPGGPIHLASSSTVAFIDPNPSLDSAPVPSYNYDPAIVGGLGLGFHVEEEEEEEEVEEEREEEEEEEVERGGFISIGGVRVYAEDTSSPEEDDVSGSESSESEGEESDGSSPSDDDYEDGSEIDEELAKDYVEMIGGSEELMNSEWLAKNDIGADGGFLELHSSSDGDMEKLGAVDMMNASVVYGMMRKEKKKAGKGKSKSGSPMVEIGLSAAMDDLVFAKDPRSARRRRKKEKEKKALSQLSRSWPREGQRSREYYGDSGGKKKHRKELIAIKRRERMINRGVDLDQINSKLRQLVVHEVDMFSFQPMHSRDCSQVQRLASIYRLRSGCQGSGKKRYVTVTRTSQTCLPSSQDKIRLDKLLGEGIREDFVVKNETITKSDRQLKGRSKSDRKLSLHQSAPAKFTENGKTSGRKKRYEKQSSAPYSARPVPFVSCGTMQVDSATETPVPDSSEPPTIEKQKDPSSSKVGAFEMHTKGFGSKMMAKMGFIEGGGLGKDRQGRAHAIEAIQRPKSLGLGMQFDEVAEDKKVTKVTTKVTKVGGSETGSIGVFEKHTKGFGSKMMAKMGFVEGTGLGRDAQGIINPLTAVRRPKARGLGAET